MTMSRREAIGIALLFTGGLAAGTRGSLAMGTDQAMQLSLADLKRDAGEAWRYFAGTGRGPRRGLVPAAVWPEGDSYGSYDSLTMWDMGSIILAYVSALSIGLIEAKEFDERVTTVVAFMKRSEFRWGKLVLPNYRTSITDGRFVEPGYDATDTGRLLVALHILDKATGGAHDASKLVARWDLGGVVVEGAPHDVKSTKRIKSECHNYIYYIARAHRLWDIEVATGYKAHVNPEDSEARNAFLAHVAKIGAIASEPSLNEAIELGHSAQSQILAETLYAAQRERFEETGLLTCVSEAPIDKKPWFTYQGYNPKAEGWYRWPVHSVVTDDLWSTKSFADTYRMVNTKAAYMCLAATGDDYALKLREHIWSKARSGSRGFAPGVYETTGKCPRITDVNTNAAVLASIASIIAGHKPLATLKV